MKITRLEAGNENNPQPAIMINTQYIKDLSLEIPFAPEIFRELTEAPHVDIHVDVDAQHMHDNYFNVNLSVKMDGSIKGKNCLFWSCCMRQWFRLMCRRSTLNRCYWWKFRACCSRLRAMWLPIVW